MLLVDVLFSNLLVQRLAAQKLNKKLSHKQKETFINNVCFLFESLSLSLILFIALFFLRVAEAANQD